jgi:hypothetical protein
MILTAVQSLVGAEIGRLEGIVVLVVVANGVLALVSHFLDFSKLYLHAFVDPLL